MAHTKAQHEAYETFRAAQNAEVTYAGRDGGELLRLEGVTNAAAEEARRMGVAVPDARLWR